jgi:hypothetical protein
MHNLFSVYFVNLYVFRGPGSVAGIVTGYGLDGPGIESRWGRDFPHLSRPALGPTQPPVPLGPARPPVQWVPGLSRG